MSKTDREIKRWPLCGMDEEQFLKEFGDALQHAWDDFCIDTGCFPDNFTLDRDILTADFSSGNFIRLAANMFSNEIRPKVAEMLEEIEQLKKALYEWEEREAAVCPEDFGFEEVISKLKAERDAALALAENRKCCGNCGLYGHICDPYSGDDGKTKDAGFCDDWQPWEQGE